MARCVIVGSAGIGSYKTVRSYLRSDDYNIICDGGLRHLELLGLEPHLIVGDFDSHPKPCMDVETIVLPCEKDDTDTVYAVKEALQRGFDQYLLVGAAGGRLDHTLGNLSVLLMLDSLGKKAVMLDDYSEMEIVSGGEAFVEDSFVFFSLLNISGAARDITVQNAKYPLQDAEITCEYQYGISNEPLAGGSRISVGEGRLLLVKVREDAKQDT